MAEQREQVYEDHPFRHNWFKSMDYVTARNSRGRAIEVKRIAECEHCPITKVTLIDTNVWEDWHVVRKPYYRRGKVKIVRKSRQEYLREQFMQTTNLTMDDLKPSKRPSFLKAVS